MFLINNITASPRQSQNLTLPDGTIVTLEIYFIPMQNGWFITNLTYGTFIVNGIRISNNPNILLQYQNQIPFGFACYSTANREPSLQQDFSSGASKLYILDKIECEEYFQFLQIGAS